MVHDITQDFDFSNENLIEVDIFNELSKMSSTSRIINIVDKDTDLSYGAQITSLIRDKYSLDAELAVTHNGGDEYLEFLEYRRRVKSALI